MPRCSVVSNIKASCSFTTLTGISSSRVGFQPTFSASHFITFFIASKWQPRNRGVDLQQKKAKGGKMRQKRLVLPSFGWDLPTAPSGSDTGPSEVTYGSIRRLAADLNATLVHYADLEADVACWVVRPRAQGGTGYRPSVKHG